MLVGDLIQKSASMTIHFSTFEHELASNRHAGCCWQCPAAQKLRHASGRSCFSQTVRYNYEAIFTLLKTQRASTPGKGLWQVRCTLTANLLMMIS